jgi:glycosyltransferase involved in cell wall biosynthesis
MPGTDILVVSLATTGGWRAAASELASAFERTGASVALVEAARPRDVRTFALTDYVQARAAQAAALRGIASHSPRAVVYCSMTSALLWPVAGAVWLDSVAAENRPGRHGLWQRRVERLRLREATVVLAMSERSLDPVGGGYAPAVVVPVPVEPSGPAGVDGPASEGGPGGAHGPVRDLAALTYAGDPLKKRLDVVLAAWERARRDDEKLVVAGTDALPGGARHAGVELAGRLPPDEYRALLRRARVFVAAPRREDYGIAPLEALADGCMLVTTPAPGPFPAMRIASQLDPRLVDDDLAGALRVALDDPPAGYSERAASLLEPFRRASVDRTITRDVLPRLLPDFAR